MDSGSRNSLQTDEETHRGSPNADRTKGKAGANHILSRGQRSYQCSLNDRKGGKQMPVYFAYTIVVITDRPIKQLLSNSEITERILKWKFELEGYDIQYRLRISIKGQILADFIVEQPKEESPDELMTEPEELPEPWTLFTDGSSCIDGSGAGLILTIPEGVEFTYAMRFSQPVNGSYVMKESGMVQYLEKVKTLTSNFKEFSIKQVPRSENKKADALSKIASTSFAHLSKQVLAEELNEKSINEKEVLAIVEEEGHTWMTPICKYITKEILPKDKKKVRAVRRKASRFRLPGEIVSDNGK
ncbi:reverse transcriptase domain-containing protein [Tanacetum coccineum]